MKKSIFKYAVIRFRPYAETAEFANIGVFALDVESGRSNFELAPKRFARIKHFFDEYAYDAFHKAIDNLRVELGRATDFLPSWPTVSGHEIFEEIVKSRESSISFSDPRTILSENDLESLTRMLFARFVRRELVSDNQEILLTQNIRRGLLQNGIRGFKSLRIDDELIPVSFPLAVKDFGIRAIKPLAFSQKSPMAIVDYGAHWRKRLRYLLDKDVIQPNNILLVTEPPASDSEDHLRDAYRLARDDLRDLPFEIVRAQSSIEVNPRVIEFARSSPRRQLHWAH